MFSAKVREQLGHYVYLYIDPRDGRPFYVGKGCGNRCFSHLRDRADSEKVKRLTELGRLGLEPVMHLLKWALTEEDALLVEATAIDLLGIDTLTNSHRGHGSRHGARAAVQTVIETLNARPVTIKHPAILIIIRRAFAHQMGLHELYDATRAAWVLGPRREKAEFALSVFDGIVREVFEIASWMPGGSTMRLRDKEGRSECPTHRWEFVGQVAEERIRKMYKGRSVKHYFQQGAQNPIQYVNC